MKNYRDLVSVELYLRDKKTVKALEEFTVSEVKRENGHYRFFIEIDAAHTEINVTYANGEADVLRDLVVNGINLAPYVTDESFFVLVSHMERFNYYRD